MKKLKKGFMSGLCLLALIAISISALADESISSPFIGTWKGEWKHLTDLKAPQNPVIIKFVSDGRGGVAVEFYETRLTKGKVSPSIISQTQNELLIEFTNGNQISMKLVGSEIWAKWAAKNGTYKWDAIFKKEQEQ
jgi:hypothetical protein